jgi:hypothetical protein
MSPYRDREACGNSNSNNNNNNKTTDKRLCSDASDGLVVIVGTVRKSEEMEDDVMPF